MSDETRDRIATDRLAELRGAMAGLESSERIKPAVLAAFRSAQTRPRIRVLRWASVAAAVVIAMAVGFYWSHHRAPETAQVSKPPAPPEASVHEQPPAVRPQPVVAARQPVPRPKRKLAAKPAGAPAPRQEVATEFIALPYAPPIDANEEAQVIRVRLPRSAMRTVGLPVNEDRWFERVPADVLLGQDGVARAVRFVKVAQSDFR